MKLATAILVAAIAPDTALSVEIGLPPGAVLTDEEVEPYGSVSLPWGPYPDDGVLPVIEAEGTVARRAYEIGSGALTSLQLLVPLREQLTRQGFAEVYSCEDDICGGYDFRFALDLLPAPAMYVDLGDYRYYLGARDGEDGREHVSIVTSRGNAEGFVHITEVAPTTAALILPEVEVEVSSAPPPAPVASGAPLEGQLLEAGHAILDGLAFPSGSASLAEDAYPSLRAVAAFLEENPTAVVSLVGHTDSVGGLDANTRLSRDRARAVRTRLIGAYDLDPDRILAEGAGFLAPRASNLTPEGRAANRRVEVVLLSLE